MQSINSTSWEMFGKNVLANNTAADQRHFLEACRDGKEPFLEYVERRLEFDADYPSDINPLRHKFTEGEFCHPSEKIGKMLWDHFHKKLPKELASSCSFWGSLTLSLVRDGYIEPAWLATNSRGSGKARIASVLRSLDRNDDELDLCLRRILRSMCNPMPRGHRIVFFDYPIGKVYWRHYWAKVISSAIELDFERTLELLGISFYGDLSANLHSGSSCIAQTNVLAGFILYLDYVDNEGTKLTTDEFRLIVKRLDLLSELKLIETQKPTENKLEIIRLVEKISAETATD